MKEYTYGKDSWQGWTNRLKEFLGKDMLTEQEIKKAMKMYINGKKVEEWDGFT